MERRGFIYAGNVMACDCFADMRLISVFDGVGVEG